MSSDEVDDIDSAWEQPPLPPGIAFQKGASECAAIEGYLSRFSSMSLPDGKLEQGRCRYQGDASS